MSVMLNDNFEGGAFEFASYAKEECNITPIEAVVCWWFYYYISITDGT